MLALRYFMAGVFDLVYTCNGVLSGLVAVTAGCSVIEPWAAILAGGIAPFVYVGFETLMHRLEIDDAVGAAPVHMGSGMWGVLFVGFLAKPNYLEQVRARLFHPGRDHVAPGLLRAVRLCWCARLWSSSKMQVYGASGWGGGKR